jgi:hypothetical protein
MFQKIIEWLFGKKEDPERKENNYLEYLVPDSLIQNFIQQAKQKIQTEGWEKQGRNVDVKIKNFVNCWITEEAVKQLLIKNNKWFRYRGLYFGDAEGAGADFIVKINNKTTTLGIRSISSESLTRWKTVPYPDDRFIYEKEKIADHHIVCHQEKGKVRIYGIISKENLLKELQNSKRLYSPKNQEHFRVINLERFSFSELKSFLDQLDAV